MHERKSGVLARQQRLEHQETTRTIDQGRPRCARVSVVSRWRARVRTSPCRGLKRRVVASSQFATARSSTSRTIGGRFPPIEDFPNLKEAGYLAKRRSSVSPEGGRTRATTNYARSARVSFGCRACRRSSASSWRSTRISSSFEPRGRPSSHRSASTFRTARYANDQSKQPSLDHDSKSPEPSQVALLGEAGRSLRTLRVHVLKDVRTVAVAAVCLVGVLLLGPAAGRGPRSYRDGWLPE